MAEEDTLRNRFAKRAQDALRAGREGYNTASSGVRDFWRGSAPGAAPPPGAAPAGAAPPGEGFRERTRTTAGQTGRANPAYGDSRPSFRATSNAAGADLTRSAARSTAGTVARRATGGGALGVLLEANNLATIDREQGTDAMVAELPRAGGRMGGGAAGFAAGMSLPIPNRPARFVAGLGLGAVGAIGGEKLVDRLTRGAAPAPTGEAPYDKTAPDGRRYRWSSGGPVPTQEFEPATTGGADATQNPKPDFSNVRGGSSTVSKADADRMRRNEGLIAASEAIEANKRAQDPRFQPTRMAEDPVAIAPNTAPEVQGITRRATQDIGRRTEQTRDRITSAMLNPNGNEADLLRRGINAAKFHGRGSPSMRKAIMDAYTGRLDSGDRASIAGMGDGNAAAARGADNEFGANEAFADRRMRNSQFNAELGEGARRADMNVDTEIGRVLANARSKQTEAAQRREEAAFERADKFITDRYGDYMKQEGMTPGRASQMAAADAAAAGMPMDATYIGAQAATDEARAFVAGADPNDRWAPDRILNRFLTGDYDGSEIPANMLSLDQVDEFIEPNRWHNLVQGGPGGSDRIRARIGDKTYSVPRDAVGGRSADEINRRLFERNR